MIYFDNAATTLIKPYKVQNTLYNLSNTAGNAGRAGHKPSMISANIIFKTRKKLCEFFNFDKPENIIFTYNATYALNLAIKGYITEKCTVLTSSYEHNSTIRPLNTLKDVNVKIVESELYNQEEFLENFKSSIDDDTKFAVINHVSNVFGYILPIKEIDEICFEHGIKLILDISQSAGILSIDLSIFKSVIAVCMPAHKSLYGTMGLGILIAIDDDIVSIIQGGTGSLSSSVYQPDFLPDILESGTHNIPAIGALYYGIEYVESIKDVNKKLFALAEQFSKEMSKQKNTIVFFNDNIKTQSGVISFYNKDFDNELLSGQLANFNICTRAGFHCSPLAHKSANTDGTIRVSFSTFNSVDEIDKFFAVYNNLVK